MHFNSDKFECIRFWPRKPLAPNFEYLGPDGEKIEVKDTLKDLGVLLSSGLSFRLQVDKTVAAASKLASWGLRTFRRRGQDIMKTIWKCLVQPKLDYCSQFWSPGDQESINKIESVQQHFLSRISSLVGHNYWDKLKRLQLYSQERRRERYMILFLWKLSQGLVHGYEIQFTSSSGRRGRTALPHSVVQSSPALVRNARESSLGVKGARIFNLLPAYIRNIDSDSVDSFKSHLDNFLTEIPDQPTIAGLGRSAESNSLEHQIPMFMLNRPC